MKTSFKVLRWTIKWITQNHTHLEALTYWENLVFKWIRAQGPLNTVKRIKAIRLHVTRYWCSSPLKQAAFPGIGLNSKGLPKSLGPLLPLITSGDKWDKRIVLSMLSISRAIPCRGTVSTREIEDTGKPVPQSTIDQLIITLYMLNWKISRPEWTRPHYSLKAGPNGQAMMGSIFDAHHLSDEDLQDLKVLGSSQELIDNIISIRENISIESWNNEFH